jgi:hypoxanthine-guanine phosphoribosyltransferase
MSGALLQLASLGPQDVYLTSNPEITLFKKASSNHPDLVYGFELEGESWLIGYGLDDDKGLQRNLKHIIGLPKED